MCSVSSLTYPLSNLNHVHVLRMTLMPAVNSETVYVFFLLFFKRLLLECSCLWFTNSMTVISFWNKNRKLIERYKEKNKFTNSMTVVHKLKQAARTCCCACRCDVYRSCHTRPYENPCSSCSTLHRHLYISWEEPASRTCVSKLL